MHKKACKQFAKDKQLKNMDYWNHFLWSDETKINLFGSDGVKRVWWQPGEKYKCVLPTVNHAGGSVMVWGCMSAAGTGELQFIEGTMNANMYCDILKQSMFPSKVKVKVFICHIINYTGYNQKWNVIKSGPLSGQCKRIKNTNYIKVTQHKSIYMVKKEK